MNNYNLLIGKHEAICQTIAECFAKKHGMYLEYWVGDEVGGLACFGDHYFFNVNDMTEDLKHNYPKGAILDWFDDRLENKAEINLRTYIKLKQQ
ncbi:MAG: hypothetical protein N4A45_10385 [Flavobacteriales bacterium]|jgi:hypothetical protein|nr:hypothetical protein [Flavobacteriales bacterium]